jgi:hypothetical protein
MQAIVMDIGEPQRHGCFDQRVPLLDLGIELGGYKTLIQA